MNRDVAWKEAFPIASAQKVVTFVLATWHDLASRKQPAFGWTRNERKLTTLMKQALADRSHNAGLSGNWGAEDVSLKYDKKTLEVTREFRTDIQYYSDREYPKILSLTFEWKKLRHGKNSLDAYHGAQGMGRFLEVDGYAKNAPFGLMVGIVESPTARVRIEALKKSMLTEEAAADLCYIPSGTGKLIREPSDELPGLAEFDTQHVRVSGEFHTFLFSHLLVSFPD